MSVPLRIFSFTFNIVALTLLMLGLWLSLALAGDSSIAMLTSQDTEPYKKVLTGFREYLTQHDSEAVCHEYSLQGEDDRATQVLQKIRNNGTKMLLTVGSMATQAAIEGAGNLPIVACLIVNASILQNAANATGVLLDFPLEIQLQWIKNVLPQNRTIGVLFNPQENQHKVEEAIRIAQSMGLLLIAREVQNPHALPDALKSVAREADVLWGIPDQIVVSPQTAKPLLLFSFRNRIPFVGLSTPWVEAGALYALDRDYTDLGAQCGELALQILQGKPAKSLPPISPRKVIYALNMKTADYMKVDIPHTLVENAQQVFQ